MKAPEEHLTQRLLLRRPRRENIDAIFERFASDPEVTRYVAWPTHRTTGDTERFIAFSDAEWQRHPGGPYLIFSNDTRELLGSTGFAFDTPYRAATGYVLARDAWGKQFAVEAMQAIASLSAQLGVMRLYADVHTDHRRSARVLEKSEFLLEGTLRRYCVFPNLDPGRPADVLCYSRIFA